jgi:hypothetical protein
MAPAPDALSLGPIAARALLIGRDGDLPPGEDPHRGVTAPQDINNTAMFALFGVIGAAFVCVGIWFFFWAKNGGFYYKESDWDDYKTTVLRRRGPNGTILSGATPSTQLGGGSIYKDIDDASTEYTGGMTVISGTTAMSGITAGVSDISGREKRRKKREAREREKERKREEKQREKLTKKNKSGRKVNEDGVVDEEAEAEAEAHLRSYRHEKPARVGGLNKQAEGSNWDGSTNPSNSTTAESTVTSDLMSHREKTPTSTPTKQTSSSTGIRKVYSTADRTADRESERIRAEARRLQDKGRAATGRRDFSYQRAPPSSHSIEGRSETHVPGSWTGSDAGSEIGTKTYRHVIPGLSSNSSGAGSSVGTATTDFAYGGEQRKKRQEARYRREQGH